MDQLKEGKTIISRHSKYRNGVAVRFQGNNSADTETVAAEPVELTAAYKNKWIVNRRDKLLVLNPDNIAFIIAVGAYSNVILKNGTQERISVYLNVFAQHLADGPLVRISRSVIVNLDDIVEIVKPDEKQDNFVVVFNSGYQLEMESSKIILRLIQYMEDSMTLLSAYHIKK